MGTFRHRSVRWLALTAAAAAAASGLAALGGVGMRVAAADLPEFVFINGSPISQSEGDGFDGAKVVGQFVDTGAATECLPANFTATIDWGDTKTSPGTVTCALVTPAAAGAIPAAIVVPKVAVYSVKGDHTYADSGTYDISITPTDTNDSKTATAKTDTATISDKTISYQGPDNANPVAVEGQSATVTAFFYDNNGSYSCNSMVDPSITATIDWGDGGQTKNVKPTIPTSSGCNSLAVTGSHVYDAAAMDYAITVSVKDDGGQTASSSNNGEGRPPITATISDGQLTAGADKSLSQTAGTVANQTVGSFTDAAGAQASAADFSATINWGDNSSSVGTVKQTGGGAAFDVTGAHGYSTTGTKSITVTVTDQEGQSVTLKATATVSAAPAPAAAAPVALPTTGQSQPPSSPLPLALLILGAMAVLGLGGTLLFRRTTR